MNLNERLELQKMISVNGTTDQTELIRRLKHSDVLRDEINKIIDLKAKNIDNFDNLNFEAMNECCFLNTYYTDIYNRLLKDELNIEILYNFLDVLKEIENGMLDQHEASYKVGKVLKEIYVDSALKKAEKINKQYPEEKKEDLNKGISLNWNDFKKSLKKNK